MGAIHEVTIEAVGDVEVVSVTGEIDLSNAHALSDALASTSTAGVALDLAELTHIDSAGIRAVDLGYRSLASEGRSLVVIVAPGTAAEWIFRVLGLSEGLRAESLAEALAVLREGASQPEAG